MSQMQKKLMVATVIGIGVLGMTGATNVSFVSEAHAFGLGDLNPVNAAKKVGGAIKKGAKKVGGAVKDAAEEVGSTVKDGAKMGAGSLKLIGRDIKKGAQKVGSGVKTVADGLALGTGVNAAAAAWGVGQAVRGAGKVLSSSDLEKIGDGLTNVCGLSRGGSEDCLTRLGYGLQTGGQSEQIRVILGTGRGKIGDRPGRPTVRDRRNQGRPAVRDRRKRDNAQVYCVRAPCPKIPPIGRSNARKRAEKRTLNIRRDNVRCVRAPCTLRGSARHSSKSRVNQRRTRGKVNVRDHRKNQTVRDHRRTRAKVTRQANSRTFAGRRQDLRRRR